MTAQEAQLVRGLLTTRIQWLRQAIRAQESLAVPCPAGRWRWADVNTSGYGRKPPDELAADRARATQRAADYRDELALALSARAAVAEITAVAT